MTECFYKHKLLNRQNNKIVQKYCKTAHTPYGDALTESVSGSYCSTAVEGSEDVEDAHTGPIRCSAVGHLLSHSSIHNTLTLQTWGNYML